MIEMIQNQIAGLEKKLVDLRANKSLFDEAKGLDKAILSARNALAEDQEALETAKKDLGVKKEQKGGVVQKSLSALAEKMDQVLHTGKTVIEIVDGGLKMGWYKDKIYRPYHALSGGEKVIYDPALSFAMLGDSKQKTLFLEAAELDGENFLNSINHLSKIKDAQIVVLTCHGDGFKDADALKGWELIRLRQ